MYVHDRQLCRAARESSRANRRLPIDVQQLNPPIPRRSQERTAWEPPFFLGRDIFKPVKQPFPLDIPKEYDSLICASQRRKGGANEIVSPSTHYRRYHSTGTQ